MVVFVFLFVLSLIVLAQSTEKIQEKALTETKYYQVDYSFLQKA